MKTRIIFFLVVSLAMSAKSFAQSSEVNSLDNLNAQHQNQNIDNKKINHLKKQQRYDQASPEHKQKMDKRREIIKNLTPEQKELVKKERERHRQEMKKITGIDLFNDQLPTE